MITYKQIQLVNLIRIKHGFAFKSKFFTDQGNYIVLTPGNFNEAGGFRKRPGKDRAYSGEIPEGYILEKGDLIVAMTEQGEGLLGSTAIIPTSKRYLHNQRLGLIEVNSKLVDKKFIYYLFNTRIVREQIRGSASGAKVRHTSPERIYKVKVNIPELKSQKKIAAILSAYDDLTENNKRRIVLLEKMAEEIYLEWFVRMRFPGYRKMTFKKGVPEDWRNSPSIKVFDVLSGGTPKTNISAYWDGDIPFFTPKDAKDNFYVLNAEKSITEDGLRNCNSRLYRKNTIFITARGTVGKLVLAQRDMAMNQSCYALLPKSEGGIYFYFLSLNNAIMYIKGVSKSGVFDNIIVDTFKVIPIVMPSEPLIDEFNSKVGPLFEQISCLLEKNEILRSSRDMLLGRLISGKLPIESLDIQFPPSMQNEQDVAHA